MKKNRFKIICKVCRKEFDVNYFRKDKAKFCSQKCYGMSLKGKSPWNKGKKGIQIAWNKGKHTGNFGNGFKKGHKLGMFGKKHSEKTIEKIKRITKGKHNSPKTEFKKGDERIIGENNSNWNNGSSFEPYGVEFNKQLKEQIRIRDNFTCQECGFTEQQLKYTLIVHHIDYDKKNNNFNNLISLCRNCHGQTNFKRSDWTNYFKRKLTWQPIHKQI